MEESSKEAKQSFRPPPKKGVVEKPFRTTDASDFFERDAREERMQEKGNKKHA